MQGIWSRTARTRSSCRCFSCLHVATAITRRSTTAASKRQLKISDIFTACYSTILATAAFADAKVKEDRRKEWDRVISEAKAGIPKGDTGASQSLEQSGTTGNDLVLWSPQGATKDPNQSDQAAAWQTGIASEPHIGCKRAQSWAVQDSHEELGGLGTCARKISDERPPIEFGCAWGDSLSLQLLPAREPVTELHLFMKQRHTGKLIYRLLQTSGIDLQLWRERLNLQNMGYTTTLPAYSWPSDFAVAEERQDLHNSIMKLREYALEHFNIDLFVAKVCYNLLITTSPPSIDTYNLLIDAFTQLDRHDLAQVVISGFFGYSRFRPNSITVQLMLNHYRATGDHAGFQMIARRMRAVDGDMRIRKRELDQLYRPAAQQWALTSKVTRRGDFLTQKFPRTPPVFQTLVRGSLDLGTLTSSIRYVRSALREGWQVEGRLIWDLIKACVDRFDSAAARQLMAIMSSQWKGGRIFPDIEYSAGVRYTVYRLIGLCGIDTSVKEDQVPVPVKCLLRHMRLESVSQSIEAVSNTIRAVKEALGTSHFEAPTSVPSLIGATLVYDSPTVMGPQAPRPQLEGLTRACMVLHGASKSRKQRLAKQRQAQKRARVMALDMTLDRLTSRLAVMSLEIEGYRKELLSILGCRLSPRGRALYSHYVQQQGATMVSSRLDFIILILRDKANQVETPRHIFKRQPGVDKLILTTRNIPYQKPCLTLNGRAVYMWMSAEAENLERAEPIAREENMTEAQKALHTGQVAVSGDWCDIYDGRPVISYTYAKNPQDKGLIDFAEYEGTMRVSSAAQNPPQTMSNPPAEKAPEPRLEETIHDASARGQTSLSFAVSHSTRGRPLCQLSVSSSFPQPLVRQAAYM